MLSIASRTDAGKWSALDSTIFSRGAFGKAKITRFAITLRLPPANVKINSSVAFGF